MHGWGLWPAGDALQSGEPFSCKSPSSSSSSSTSLFTEVQKHVGREQSEAVFYLYASNVERIDRQSDRL